MAKKKAKQVGGVREGAGRKLSHPEGVTMPITVRVPESLVQRLDAMAKPEQSRSELVSEAIRVFLNAQ
jgi:hypothetical protein